MITKADIVGVRLSEVLEGRTESAGTWVKEIGEAFWTEFMIRLENGLLISLNEYELVPYAGETDNFKPAPLEELCMDPARSKTYERSKIEGRKIIFVGGDPHDSIYVFVDSGIGVGTFGGPGGNQLSICDQVSPEMLDYWTPTS